MIWSCTVRGDPAPQARPRVCQRNGHAFAYTPKHSAHYRKLLTLQFKIKRPVEQFTGAVSVDLRVYLRRPVGKDGNITPTGRTKYPTAHSTADIDNYCKQVIDALQDAGVLKDDACVVLLSACKAWADGPQGYIDITVEDIDA